MTALLDELVDAGVDDLHRESLGQLSQRTRCGAAYASDGAVRAGDLDAEGLGERQWIQSSRGLSSLDAVRARIGTHLRPMETCTGRGGAFREVPSGGNSGTRPFTGPAEHD